MVEKRIEDFKVLPLYFSDSITSPHEIFIKEADCEISSLVVKGCTLLVLNVPPYVTKRGLKNVFGSVGNINTIVFLKKLNDEVESQKIVGFKIAYVVFNTTEDMKKALHLETLGYVSTNKKFDSTGLEKWKRQYNARIYDHVILEENITRYMKKYDREERKRKLNEQTMDDQGWTLITKKGRTPGFARKESVDAKLLDKLNKGLESKCLSNFYTFQKREEKFKRIQNMKKQFENDKKKVELMKQNRKFRPF